MNKILLMVLALSCSISSICKGQDLGKLIPGSPSKASKSNTSKTSKPSSIKAAKTKPVTQPAPSAVVVNFLATQDCWVNIDGKDSVRISKGTSKSVKLQVGNHKLFFKSAETFGTVDSSLNVTTDMLKSGTYTYRVVFKKMPEPSKPPPKPDPSRSDTVVMEKKYIKELATIEKLSSDMVLIPRGRVGICRKRGY